MEFRRWYYLQEAVELEVLLIESFKDKKQQFLKQGANREEIDEYFAIFRKIQSSNYKKVADVIPGLTVAAPNRKNIDMYPNFQQLKIFVDYMRSQENLEVDIQVVGEPIFENNILEISYADSPRACITYKGNIPYSWCVSRKAQNYYYTYRLKPHEPSFYFVKNKIRTKKELSSWKPEDINEKTQWKDKWHFFIIQVNLGADVVNQNAVQYVVTSARNDGDTFMSWSQIVQLEPALNGMQQRFKPVALPHEDRAFVERWQHGATNKEFANMGFKEKSKFMSVYVRLGRGLTDEQFASLPPSLWNEYLNFSVGLSDKQFDMIKDKNELVKRYTELSIRKFNDLVAQTVSFSYMMPSELKVIETYQEQLDFDKMNFDQLSELLDIKNGIEFLKTVKPGKLKAINSLNDQQTAELFRQMSNSQETSMLIMKHKSELTPNDVYHFLRYSEDLTTTEKTLGTKNLEKINSLYDYQISDLFFHTLNARKLSILTIKHKSELTPDNIYHILLFSDDLTKTEELIGPENLEKINSLNDQQVGFLFDGTLNRQETSIFIIKHKRKLTRNNIYNILLFSEDLKAIEKHLRPENLEKLNQLNDESIGDLLFNTKDKEGVLDFIINYKELTPNNVSQILTYAEDLNAIKEKLRPENLNKLNQLGVADIKSLMDFAKDKEGVIDLLVNYKELTPDDVYQILIYSKDLNALKEKLRPENLEKINQLDAYHFISLLVEAKDKEGVIDLLVNYKELTPYDVYQILRFSKDLTTTKEKLRPENLNKLNQLDDKDLNYLLSSTPDKQTLIDLVLTHKKELTSKNVYYILNFSQNIEAIEKRLRPENLNKINQLGVADIKSLMDFAKDKEGIRYIIDKYRQK